MQLSPQNIVIIWFQAFSLLLPQMIIWLLTPTEEEGLITWCVPRVSSLNCEICCDVSWFLTKLLSSQLVILKPVFLNPSIILTCSKDTKATNRCTQKVSNCSQLCLRDFETDNTLCSRSRWFSWPWSWMTASIVTTYIHTTSSMLTSSQSYHICHAPHVSHAHDEIVQARACTGFWPWGVKGHTINWEGLELRLHNIYIPAWNPKGFGLSDTKINCMHHYHSTAVIHHLTIRKGRIDITATTAVYCVLNRVFVSTGTLLITILAPQFFSLLPESLQRLDGAVVFDA